MRVHNMTSSKGNDVPNQFIIDGKELDPISGKEVRVEIFQSYQSIIAKRVWPSGGFMKIVLDSTYWNYSVTTSKYRRQFLGESVAETRAKIKSGEYILTDLNS